MLHNHVSLAIANLNKEKKIIFRHCSTPEIVNSYLNVLSGEMSILTASSKICMSCYKLFNGIKKQLAQVKLGEQNSNATLDSVGALIDTP